MLEIRKTTINGKPAAWDANTWELWATYVDPSLGIDETVLDANYFTPRPYRNEYDRGSNEAGFVYTTVEKSGAHEVHMIRWTVDNWFPKVKR